MSDIYIFVTKSQVRLIMIISWIGFKRATEIFKSKGESGEGVRKLIGNKGKILQKSPM